MLDTKKKRGRPPGALRHSVLRLLAGGDRTLAELAALLKEDSRKLKCCINRLVVDRGEVFVCKDRRVVATCKKPVKVYTVNRPEEGAL